jgi:asparagine N-glycosylation enzyme membrane subunit Stt3
MESISTRSANRLIWKVAAGAVLAVILASWIATAVFAGP